MQTKRKNANEKSFHCSNSSRKGKKCNVVLTGQTSLKRSSTSHKKASQNCYVTVHVLLNFKGHKFILGHNLIEVILNLIFHRDQMSVSNYVGFQMKEYFLLPMHFIINEKLSFFHWKERYFFSYFKWRNLKLIFVQPFLQSSTTLPLSYKRPIEVQGCNGFYPLKVAETGP